MAFFDECCLKMSSRTHANQDEENSGCWGEAEEEELDLEKAAVDALLEEEIGADEFNFLDDDDMHIFGQNPLGDSLNLVSCNICKKPVIDSQFLRHYERCNAASQSEHHIVAPDHVQRRRRSLRRSLKEKLATIPEEVSDRNDQRVLHSQENTDDQQSALPLLVKGKGKAEVSELSDSERNFSEDEKSVPSKSKRRGIPKVPLVSCEVSREEVRRGGLRIRKRDVSAVCSDVRSQLPAPLSVSRKRKAHTSAFAVVPDKFSQRPSHLPISSKRRIHTKTHGKRGDDEVKKLSGATKKDVASGKKPQKTGDTTIDKKPQQARQVAGTGSRQRKQGTKQDDEKGDEKDDEKGDGSVKSRRKQGTKPDDNKGDKAFKSRQKQDRKPNVHKSLGDPRTYRREKRNRMKNQPILTNFIQKPSSKNCTSEESEAAMTSTPLLLSSDRQAHLGTSPGEKVERESKVNQSKEEDKTD